jgi:hypothetical protein
MVELPFPLLFPCAQRLHHGHGYLCSNHGALISLAAMAPPSAHSLPAPFLPSASNGTAPPAPTLSRGSNSHGRPIFFSVPCSSSFQQQHLPPLPPFPWCGSKEPLLGLQPRRPSPCAQPSDPKAAVPAQLHFPHGREPPPLWPPSTPVLGPPRAASTDLCSEQHPR